MMRLLLPACAGEPVHQKSVGFGLRTFSLGCSPLPASSGAAQLQLHRDHISWTWVTLVQDKLYSNMFSCQHFAPWSTSCPTVSTSAVWPRPASGQCPCRTILGDAVVRRAEMTPTSLFHVASCGAGPTLAGAGRQHQQGLE